jgi:hypothetical protein
LSNRQCEWLIASSNSSLITIAFSKFSTQPLVDIVHVFQCTTVDCSQQQQIAELSGRYPTTQTATSATGYMRVVFISDGAHEYDGFTASWSTVSTALLHYFYSNVLIAGSHS